jgi:hypothetical protein
MIAPPALRRAPSVKRVAVSQPPPSRRDLFVFRGFPCKSAKNKEPTSGLEPLTCSLRVMIQALQGIVRACISRINRQFSFAWFAACCTALRSRWCQSGVNFTPYTQLRMAWLHLADVERDLSSSIVSVWMLTLPILPSEIVMRRSEFQSKAQDVTLLISNVRLVG